MKKCDKARCQICNFVVETQKFEHNGHTYWINYSFDCDSIGVIYLLKGRTIRYLRGGLGKYQKKIRAQKKFRKKISCTTNLLKKKIEQELGVIFKIVLQLF